MARKFRESMRPCCDEFFGFARIAFHPYAPDQFFGTNGADGGGKAGGGPGNGREAADTAVSRGVFLFHIFGLFIESWRVLEPGPGMRDHPIVAGKFRGRGGSE